LEKGEKRDEKREYDSSMWNKRCSAFRAMEQIGLIFIAKLYR
jgi:hypothetical protein